MSAGPPVIVDYCFLVIEAQLIPVLRDAIAKAPGVTDVVVAPGVATGWDRSEWEKAYTVAELCKRTEAEPECYVGGRDPISYTPETRITGLSMMAG
jgi:hypothetical protein